MRILHLIPGLQKGGAERLCLDTVRALNRLPGTEARVAILHPVHEYAGEYPEISPVILRSYVRPSIRRRWQVDLREWEALLAEFQPQVIHTHLFEAEMLAHYAPRPGIRYVTHCHDNMHQLARPRWADLRSRQRLTEWYERHWLLQRYRQSRPIFLAISRDTETYFRSNLPPALAQNVRLFPNASDLSRFASVCPLPPSGPAVHLINIGSFVPKKNQALLVAIIQALRSAGIAATCTCLGGGPLLEQVRSQSAAAGLSAHFHLPGAVSHVEQHLALATVYVHTATYEPFGLVLIEAMAAGLPVVCLDGRGNRDLIRQGENGFLLPLPDPQAFARHIAEICQSTARWQTMSTNARQFAKNYDIGGYVDSLREVYVGNEKFIREPPAEAGGY